MVEAKKPVKRGENEPAKSPSTQTKTMAGVTKNGRATSAVLHTLTAEEREARARALRGAASEPLRSEPEYFQAEVVRPPEEPETPAVPLTRDALRQRELEEMRRIQEQEKTESSRKKQEDEVRHRDLQAARGASATSTEDRGRSALARPGESLSGRPAQAGRVATREDEEEDNRRKPGRTALAPRRGLGAIAAPPTKSM